ncbi:2-phospho-L-lactate guanylyltransferase [Saccharomonospora cyanea NA-134]|uniref:Phosphoenolpyruvate guanylyltransferase n=1 Tax=Saccharomonospora cyanea NA-134 TaxID=882082 RepID=H5XNE0_9PSEU|nr:2-phospho-L-lactate guanylyltransferase [Saccharomonospora cyanea NA-134]
MRRRQGHPSPTAVGVFCGNDGGVAVDLIVPLKRPSLGKSRLRGVLGDADGEYSHTDLVLALAFDTLRAATAAAGVDRVLVVGSDPAALALLRELEVDVVGEHAVGGPPDGGPHDNLNTALRAGERLLRADNPGGTIGALQADLPALRPHELTEAITEAGGRRAFVADRHGTGTTLLLSSPGGRLRPRFGPGSARAHTLSGARPLTAALPSLRGDVDTPGDLDHARLLGLGDRTRAVLDRACLLS